jgi:threonine/homoserine/homoserine lactone efflux protein
MVPFNELMIFAAAALFMVLTPGPNMIYLVPRSISQGRQAGIISLIGVVAGFFVHMMVAAVGLTALFMAVPLGYELLKWAGACYLLWMAWQAVKPGARSPFEAKELPIDSNRKLLIMGFLTSVLNPKIAISAAGIASWFAHNPTWLAVQRYLMGFVLASLAIRLALEKRTSV